MKSLSILKYQWKDMFRGKWIIGYGLIYLLMADAMVRFGDQAESITPALPILCSAYPACWDDRTEPCICISRAELPNLRERQPLNRKTIFWGLFGGLAVPLALAFTVGVGLPMVYFGLFATISIRSILLILVLGNVLTLLFTGLGFWLGLRFEDRM
ncbi:MAG: hypothetical protein U5J63_13945 [Fodinibius sp.]|nr:hypothetical protein [Fodinibius sp.]